VMVDWACRKLSVVNIKQINIQKRKNTFIISLFTPSAPPSSTA
jgi:hypothetical protein